VSPPSVTVGAPNDPVVRATASASLLYRAWAFALLSSLRAGRAAPPSSEGRAAALAAQLAAAQALPGPLALPRGALGPWLDAVIESGVLFAPPPLPPGTRVPAPVLTARLVERFGAGAARPLREAARALAAAYDAAGGLLERVGVPEGPVGWPEGPEAAVEALHGALRALACDLVLVRGARLPPAQRPGRAQLADLAQTWAAGSRAFLALLASLPGSDVPEHVVPVRARIDLRRIAPPTW
jgi:hypothetical protein